MITLDNFEQHIETKIIHRGKDYQQSEYVEDLELVDQREFSALVLGSETYEVYLKFSHKREVLEHSCTCPYDWGDYCKHKVAVMYEILECEKKRIAFAMTGAHLKLVLEEVGDTELKEFVFQFLKRNRAFREALLSEFG